MYELWLMDEDLGLKVDDVGFKGFSGFIFRGFRVFGFRRCGALGGSGSRGWGLKSFAP